MRILQISLSPSSLGGVPNYTKNISRALCDLGHEVMWAYPNYHGITGFQLANEGFLMKGYIPSPSDVKQGSIFPLQDMITTYKTKCEIEKILEDVNPDIIHVQHAMGTGVSFINDICNRVPVIFSIHDYWLLCQRIFFLYKGKQLCSGPLSGNCATCMQGITAAHQIFNIVPKCLKKLFSLNVKKPLAAWIREILTNHEFKLPQSHSGPEYLKRLELAKEALISSKKVLCVSHAAQFVLESSDIRGVNISTMHIGTPVTSMIELPKQTNPQERIQIGFVGPISEIKGLHVLIQALEYINNIDKIELHIWGYGDTKYFKACMIKCKHTEIVRYHGIYNNEDLPHIYSTLDVAVAPVIGPDNGPQSVLESLCLNTPVIGSKTGGIIDFLENGGGCLFEPNNPKHLAEIINSTIDNPNILNVWKATIRKPKSIRTHALELEKLYSELCVQT